MIIKELVRKVEFRNNNNNKKMLLQLEPKTKINEWYSSSSAGNRDRSHKQEWWGNSSRANEYEVLLAAKVQTAFCAAKG